MATIQERLQMKRVPIDKWSIREQLCLASAVVRSGDQNWMSVSRALKPFAEPNRPPDWFSQKNCAAQYGSMLENVETPKRKKRMSGTETVVETPGESIVRKLIEERKTELKKMMEDEKKKYLKFKEEMELIRSDSATENQVAKMCEEIDEEEKQKEQDAVAHAQWLKAREERKLEVERAFRPVGKVPLAIGQKRKASEDGTATSETEEATSTPETSKLALSPLLTSLLKTPAHTTSVTSSILHSAITNTSRGSSPTIASLLNSAASVPVSPSLQQLVTTAISQDRDLSLMPAPASTSEAVTDNVPNVEQPTEPMETDTQLTTIQVKQELLPVKEECSESPVENNEEPMDKSAIIETTELISEEQEKEIKIEKEDVIEDSSRDQYTFDSDSNSKVDEAQKEPDQTDVEKDNVKEETTEPEVEQELKLEIKEEPPDTDKEKEFTPGSVEIVEVVVMEDEDSDKESIKKNILEMKNDIIESSSNEREVIIGTMETIYSKIEIIKTETKAIGTSVYDEYDFDDKEKEEKPEEKQQQQEESNTCHDIQDNLRKSMFTPEYTEAFFDDMAIEVTKLDKSGKAKRDYSRTKKKEDKDLDILLAVEKVVNVAIDENELAEETGSEKDSQDSDNKKIKGDTTTTTTERSNSPWTEEEETSASYIKTCRRLSTPATPIDSVPNSPASSVVNLEDDRDYRTWKKSVMLVYSRLAAHKYASLFLKPIIDEHAPGYHGLVYRPMDLQSIRRSVESGVVRSTTEFQRDVLLMFNNAIMYNKSNDHVYNMARHMQQDGLQQIQMLLQVQQAQAENTPARRETRTSESGLLKRKRSQHEELLRNKKRRD